MASEERLRELEDKYEGYTVYDNRGDKIGKVDDLFIDETDREEYIGVKMGFFGRKSTLIPMDIVRVNEADRTLEVSESKDHVKDAPNFDDDEDVTPEYEERIRSHFGLQSQSSSSSQGSYGASTGTASTAGTAAGAEEGRESDQAHSDREGRDQGYADSEDRTQAESTQGEQSATGYEERSGSSTGSSGTGETGDAERESSSTGTSAGGPTGGAGRFERREPAGSQETSQETTGEAPRAPQTGETVEEGGRARVRRRIIREEIIEEDPDARS